MTPSDVRGKSLEKRHFSNNIWQRTSQRVNGNSLSLRLSHVKFLINDRRIHPICSPGLWYGPEASHMSCPSKKGKRPENISWNLSLSDYNSVSTSQTLSNTSLYLAYWSGVCLSGPIYLPSIYLVKYSEMFLQ